jgi:hypothetical protein
LSERALRPWGFLSENNPLFPSEIWGFSEVSVLLEMPASFDFVEWWKRESHHKGTPVVVKMENPNNWSMLEISSPEGEDEEAEGFSTEKERGKNAKQFTWVILLRAQQAASFLAWIGYGFFAVLCTVKTRVFLRRPNREDLAASQGKNHRGKLYRFIRAFLALSIFMLFFEVLAHVKGWSFNRPSYLHIPDSSDVQSLLEYTYIGWVDFRATYLGPPLQTLANSCIVLFLIQSLDRLIQCLGCLWIWVKKIKPVAKVKDFETSDPEQPFSGYPMVLVQIPMCNEKEV